MGSFTPTHTVGPTALPAWSEPDPRAAPAARLDPGLPVQVVEQRGGWAAVLCSNGWRGWVDGAQLVPAGARASVAAPTVAMPSAGVASGWSPAIAAPAPPTIVPGPRLVTGLVGGAVVALTAFAPWIRQVGTSKTGNAFDIPLEFLWKWDLTGALADSGLTLGIVMVMVAVLGAVAVALRPLAPLAFIVALLTMVLPVLYVARMGKLVADVEEFNPGLVVTDLLGWAVPVAVAGGMVLMIGSFLRTRPR